MLIHFWQCATQKIVALWWRLLAYENLTVLELWTTFFIQELSWPRMDLDLLHVENNLVL